MNTSFITDSAILNSSEKNIKIVNNNTIILNDDYVIHIQPILQNDNTLLFITPKIQGKYGLFNNYELNFVIYNFYVSFLSTTFNNKNKLIIHSNSEARYGNQTNNMSIELITDNIIQM